MKNIALAISPLTLAGGSQESLSVEQRGALVYGRFQHNRNPLVDHPEWVEAIFLPQLFIRRSGNGIIVSWESRWSGSVLEVAHLVTGFGTNALSWSIEGQIPQTPDDAFTVTLTPAFAGRLYRLRVP